MYCKGTIVDAYMLMKVLRRAFEKRPYRFAIYFFKKVFAYYNLQSIRSSFS